MATAADQAYRIILDGLLNGRFAPGERLKEAGLVRLCGVSRTPVREALRRLAAEDYLVITRNQGAQVNEWAATELDDLFELRALLEGHAAARAARWIRPEQLGRIRDAIGEMDAMLAGSAPTGEARSEFLRLNGIVHETVWEASGSTRLPAMLRRLVEQALVVRTARQFTLARLAQSHHQHQDLLKALEVGDESWAESVMRSHILAARDTMAEALAEADLSAAG